MFLDDTDVDPSSCDSYVPAPPFVLSVYLLSRPGRVVTENPRVRPTLHVDTGRAVS